ncbi:TPA: hypothetical protein RCG95_000052 [Enterobacter roggenkampii]|nr:hypothetical protein [Enterobacter roggenkampii]
MAYRYNVMLTPEDGEALMPGDANPGYSGMHVNVVAFDSNFASVAITNSMVRVMVSPSSTGNSWTVFDSGANRANFTRIKVVKSGLPGNVYRVGVFFSSTVAPSSGIPDGAFEGKRYLSMQSIKESAIKNGNLFTASRRITAVAGQSYLDSVIVTGSEPVILLSRDIGYTGTGVAASIYRDATYTGTPVAADVNNPNDINPKTMGFTLSSGVTFASGILTVAVAYSEGNQSNQGSGNAHASLGEMVIMKPNTTYVLRIQSLDASNATQNINAYISMIEGWPDIPL